jgi:hypothetical protein
MPTRSASGVIRSLESLQIPLSPAGRLLIEEAVAKLNAPVEVNPLPERKDTTAIAYSQLTERGHELFIPRGASELAVAGELMHSLLVQEGYVFPHVFHPDPEVQAYVLTVISGIVAAAIMRPVRDRLRSRGFALDLFHQVYRGVPEIPNNRPTPTPGQDVQIAINYVLQCVDYTEARRDIDEEFASAFPQALELGRTMMRTLEAVPVTSARTYRNTVVKLIKLADGYVQKHEAGLAFSIYTSVPPVCSQEELTKPTSDLVRFTDSSVLSVLQARSQQTAPYVFLIWKPDNSTIQVRAVAHNALLLQVKESLRAMLGRPLRDVLEELGVRYWPEVQSALVTPQRPKLIVPGR